MNALPEGWHGGAVVPGEEIYGAPPNSQDKTKLQFYGLRKGDPGHRLYSIPVETKVSTVVRLFEVGAHGANSYLYDQDETIDLVAKKAEAIAALVPCRVVFADSAGLKLQFTRQITADEVQKIEAMFPDDIQMQAGLERYLSEWDGESLLLKPVLKENLIHLWWD